MNTPETQPESIGHFITPPNVNLGVLEVDCSDWLPDIPKSEWSTGNFVPALRPLPPVGGDFRPAREGLEIHLRLAPNSDAGQASLLALRMLTALHQAAPELRLRYDQAASRAERGDVTIVLSTEAGGVAERLQQLSEVVDAAIRGASVAVTVQARRAA